MESNLSTSYEIATVLGKIFTYKTTCVPIVW